jgi:SAM-dependent methyltransferase
MADAVAARIRRYILDGSDEDLRRLMRISQVSEEMVRTALRRVGAREGWTAIDCGCGPLGALPVLAETVGPTGRVVGVDVNSTAVQRAQAVASALDLNTVTVVAGDLHELGSSALGGPFDLAYTRLFLMHQPDPVRTLRHIADLLRPGGLLVTQEALPHPTPRSHPPLEALTGYWDLLHEAMGLAGVPSGVVEGLPRFAGEAGFEIAGTNGYFYGLEPHVGFEIHAATLAAARDRGMSMGIPPHRFDDLARAFDTAMGGGYEWVSSPFFLDLTLRKP